MRKISIIVFLFFMLTAHTCWPITYYTNENFNSLSDLNEAEDYLSDWNNAELSATGGVGGSKCLKVSYPSAVTSGLAIYTPSTVQAIWVGMDQKVDCAAGDCHGGAKFVKFFQDSTYRTNMTFRLRYETGDMDYVATGLPEVSQGDDNQGWRYNGTCFGCSGNGGVDMHEGTVTYSGELDHHKDGNWHHMDYYIKLNSDSSYDGEVKVYVDGTLKLWVTNAAFRPNTADVGFDHVSLGDYCSSGQFTDAFYLYFDNLTITDEQVGAAPSNTSSTMGGTGGAIMGGTGGAIME